MNSNSTAGAGLSVEGGSTLSAGRLVTMSDDNVVGAPPSTVTISGAGSKIVVDDGVERFAGGIDFASQGSSSLVIRDGGRLDVISRETCEAFNCPAGNITNAAGSNGSVLVSGSGSVLNLGLGATQATTIGAAVVLDDGFGTPGGDSTANVSIVDGGTLNTGYAFLAVAAAAEGNANTGTESVTASVTVSGTGSVWNSEAIAVGFDSDSERAPDVFGSLIVSNGGEINSDIYVGSAGVLGGNGSIFGGLYNYGGLISPGLSPGTLTIDGDFVFDGGTLIIDVFGLAVEQRDFLNITGEATLSSGKILFNFEDYLPEIGDSLDFLSAAGGLSLDTSVSFGYAGLAQGFDFDISRLDGAMSFVAFEDARSVPLPGTLLLCLSGLASCCRKTRRGSRMHAKKRMTQEF